MSTPTSLAEAFGAMPSEFNADAATGVDAVFQFDLSGDDGAKYWIKVANQTIDVNEGEHDSPDITIVATAENYLKLVNGELNAMNAFMQGKIKVKGNMGLAMKLQSMFGLG